MSIISDVAQITTSTAARIFSIVMIVIPGLAVLLQYYPHTVYSLDVIKVILVAATITMPLLFLYALVVFVGTYEMSSMAGQKGEIYATAVYTCAVIITFFVMFFWLGIAFYTGMGFWGYATANLVTVSVLLAIMVASLPIWKKYKYSTVRNEE